MKPRNGAELQISADLETGNQGFKQGVLEARTQDHMETGRRKPEGIHALFDLEGSVRQ
jgi:hypothetical protein